MTYTPDELNEQSENIPEVFTGEITEIVETTAGEIYGDEANDPDRANIQVGVSVDEFGQEFVENFSLPTSPKSWLNANFKLKQFKDEYGSVPEEGMEVQCRLGSDGFLELIL